MNTDVCNETNLMHYLSPVYSVTIHLHVSGSLVAHHQEVTMYICDKWYVLVDCQLAWLGWNCTTRTNCHIQGVLARDTKIHAYVLVPKHVARA
jgi:hypothetical protein